MSKIIKFGRSTVSEDGPCYVIAEIGHNHQGEMEKALQLVRVAASMGANAVKFQKRDYLKTIISKQLEMPYLNNNSFGRDFDINLI